MARVNDGGLLGGGDIVGGNNDGSCCSAFAADAIFGCLVAAFAPAIFSLNATGTSIGMPFLAKLVAFVAVVSTFDSVETASTSTPAAAVADVDDDDVVGWADFGSIGRRFAADESGELPIFKDPSGKDGKGPPLVGIDEG